MLRRKGFNNILSSPSSHWDLRRQNDVEKFFQLNKPEYVFIAAAKVGGIVGNKNYPAEFIYENLQIQNNIIHQSHLSDVQKLLFLGSSCIYPAITNQPINENQLLTGQLEETNEPYAIAKIAGIKMCESYNNQYKTNYKCLMPTNTFGPNDNYHTLNSHFIPSLLKKIYDLKSKKKSTIKIWGDGSPKREIIYVDDIADACVYFMNRNIKENLINIGTGKELTIKEYVNLFLKILIPNKKIKIVFDKSKPNGTPRKLMDVRLAKKYGWKSKTNLKEAIIETFNSYSYKK